MKNGTAGVMHAVPFERQPGLAQISLKKYGLTGASFSS